VYVLLSGSALTLPLRPQRIHAIQNARYNK
jgi:hypothetical protein